MPPAVRPLKASRRLRAVFLGFRVPAAAKAYPRLPVFFLPAAGQSQVRVFRRLPVCFRLLPVVALAAVFRRLQVCFRLLLVVALVAVSRFLLAVSLVFRCPRALLRRRLVWLHLPLASAISQVAFPRRHWLTAQALLAPELKAFRVPVQEQVLGLQVLRLPMPQLRYPARLPAFQLK